MNEKRFKINVGEPTTQDSLLNILDVFIKLQISFIVYVSQSTVLCLVIQTESCVGASSWSHIESIEGDMYFRTNQINTLIHLTVVAVRFSDLLCPLSE